MGPGTRHAPDASPLVALERACGRWAVPAVSAGASNGEGASSFWPYARPAVVNGTAGFVVMRADAPYAVLAFTVRGRRIVELDVVADPARLSRLDLSVLDD
jgi:hypothetical protein